MDKGGVMDKLKFKLSDGEPFTITMDASYFQKNDIVNTFSKDFKVVKVRKFNWFRRLLFKFGVPFNHADLKEVKK